jgi:hypothetical protein
MEGNEANNMNQNYIEVNGLITTATLAKENPTQVDPSFFEILML